MASDTVCTPFVLEMSLGVRNLLRAFPIKLVSGVGFLRGAFSFCEMSGGCQKLNENKMME